MDNERIAEAIDDEDLQDQGITEDKYIETE